MAINRMTNDEIGAAAKQVFADAPPEAFPWASVVGAEIVSWHSLGLWLAGAMSRPSVAVRANDALHSWALDMLHGCMSELAQGVLSELLGSEDSAVFEPLDGSVSLLDSLIQARGLWIAEVREWQRRGAPRPGLVSLVEHELWMVDDLDKLLSIGGVSGVSGPDNDHACLGVRQCVSRLHSIVGAEAALLEEPAFLEAASRELSAKRGAVLARVPTGMTRF